MRETLIVSGLYSGPSPSAGLGVARSLRTAFPSAHIVGVDYYAGSSGLHHEVFDSLLLKPSWNDIDEALCASEVQAELDRGALWISTLDLEIAWFARALPARPRDVPRARAATPRCSRARRRTGRVRDRYRWSARAPPSTCCPRGAREIGRT